MSTKPKSKSRVAFTVVVTRSAEQKSQTVTDPAKLAKALSAVASKAKSDS